MLNLIRKTYGQFSDSWIQEFTVKDIIAGASHSNRLSMTIACQNIKNDFEYELIVLNFIDVLEFTFIYSDGSSNFSISDLFYSEAEGKIVFDFSPIDHFDFLEENQASKFKIVCKNISYEFLHTL